MIYLRTVSTYYEVKYFNVFRESLYGGFNGKMCVGEKINISTRVKEI